MCIIQNVNVHIIITDDYNEKQYKLKLFKNCKHLLMSYDENLIIYQLIKFTISIRMDVIC